MVKNVMENLFCLFFTFNEIPSNLHDVFSLFPFSHLTIDYRITFLDFFHIGVFGNLQKKQGAFSRRMMEGSLYDLPDRTKYIQ